MLVQNPKAFRKYVYDKKEIFDPVKFPLVYLAERKKSPYKGVILGSMITLLLANTIDNYSFPFTTIPFLLTLVKKYG